MPIHKAHRVVIPIVAIIDGERVLQDRIGVDIFTACATQCASEGIAGNQRHTWRKRQSRIGFTVELGLVIGSNRDRQWINPQSSGHIGNIVVAGTKSVAALGS